MNFENGEKGIVLRRMIMIWQVFFFDVAWCFFLCRLQHIGGGIPINCCIPQPAVESVLFLKIRRSSLLPHFNLGSLVFFKSCFSLTIIYRFLCLLLLFFFSQPSLQFLFFLLAHLNFYVCFSFRIIINNRGNPSKVRSSLKESTHVI